MKSNRSELPPDLAEALAGAADRFGLLGSRIIYHAETGSTSDDAAALATDLAAEGTIVLADRQTKGRGRRGRDWFSPPGSGLYVSVVLTPARASDPPRATMLLTLMAAVGLSDAVRTAAGIDVAIKWPNDLLIGGRKLAGILAEGLSGHGRGVESVVLGYGINVARTSFPPELASRATSLESELGREIDRFTLFAETVAALAARYDDLLSGRFDAILDDWRARAYRLRGAPVTWDGPHGVLTGESAGIDDDGALLVRTGGRIERIVAGEVRWG